MVDFAPIPMNPTLPQQTDENAISLAPTEIAGSELDTQIKVLPAVPEQIVPVTDAFAVEQKAHKVDFALGPESPGLNVLRDNLWYGQDGQLRDRVALSEQLKGQKIKTQMMQSLIQQATETGTPMTPEDEAFIMALTQEQLQDPKTIFEKLYARRMVNALTVMSAANWQNTLQESVGENPQKTYGLMDAYQDIFTKQEIAQELKRQSDEEFKGVSWAQFIPETAIQFVPGYNWVRFRSTLTGAGELSALLGSKLEEYYERAYLLPPDQFRALILADYEKIKQYNHTLAKQFMDGVVSYSTSDRVAENAFTIADVVDVATLGATAVVKGVRASGRLANRLRTGLNANVNPGMELADALVAAGNVPAAADQKVVKYLTKVQSGTNTVQDEVAMRFGLLDPQNYARNPGSLAAEQTRRLVDDLSGVVDNLTNTVNPERTMVLPRVDNPAAIEQQFVQARASWDRNYGHLTQHVIDIRPQRRDGEVYTGVDRLVIDIGRKDASAFETPSQAKLYANLMKLSNGQFEIVERDGNFVIRMYKNVDETTPVVREARTGTDNQTSTSRLNRWIGAIRSPKDILSPAHNRARDVATYGSNEILRYMRKAFEKTGSLTNVKRDRIRTLLTDNQTEMRAYVQPDGSTKNLPGNWYDTFADFEAAYLKRFGEMPSEDEYLAYFTVRETSDWGFQMQKLGMVRDKQRVGGEQKAVVFPGKERKTSEWFEARTADKLPDWSAQPFTVTVVDDKGQYRTYFSSKMNKKQKELVDKRISEGHEVLQPLNPNDPVLRQTFPSGGDVINYVLSKTTKTKPLDLDAQLQYRAGGHAMYDPNMVFIKGANTWKTSNNRRIYGGDVTLQAFDSPAQAQKFLDAYETARRMIKENQPNKKVLEFLHQNTPFRTIKEFKLLFNTDGGPLDWDGPLALVRDGQRLTDVTDFTKFYRDPVVDVALNSHNPMAGVNTRWTQERQTLLTVDELGSQGTPMFDLKPVQMMDPIEALNRSAAELIRNRFFEDYKHRSVEDWVTQFRQLLDVPEQEAFGNPMRMLREAPELWKDNIQSPEILAAAKSSRRAILQLLAQESPMAQQFKWAREKMLDTAYARYGQAGVDKMKAVPDWLVGAKADPVAFARARVFDAKLGLWNPLQLPLQAQSVIHAAAIDGNPLRAIQANLSAWMMRAYRSEDMTSNNFLGRVARKALGLPEEQFKEMYDSLRRSGMMNIEGEVSTLDDVFAPNVTPLGIGGRVWDSSRIFFREGERYVRMTAFNTAYLNWRQNNPLAKLTPEIERSIVRRADDLSINMTRASNNPVLQQGPQSAVTQFMTYHARLSEQMLGGRLTPIEKARVMLVYSAAYGVPLGVAGTSLGLFAPVYETYRKYALDNNIDLQDWKIKAFLEGIPQMALSAVVGQDVSFASRYGPGGMSFFRDLLMEGKVSVLLGPAGSFIRDVLKHHEPFTHTLVSLVDPKANDRFPVTSEDFMDMFKEISIVNNAARGWMMWQTGKLITKGETIVGDVDKKMALFTFLTGLQPQFATDAFLKASILRDEGAAKREIEKEAGKHFARAMRAWADGNINEGEAHAKKARTVIMAGGFNEIETGQMMYRFMTQNSEYADKIGKDFVTRGPAEKRMQRWQREVEDKERQLQQGVR